ncbi:hypothetical protein GQ55_5G452700 [Panicum hallii var. hallii]|uniref:Uncharacterized protein n=1 Tax=Panicum hallii var. hallii TaxID=1504633 RepID=A0A2T7DQ66_9POAL|nr:hypothetical protein GQ55_5G452700 [Panicum hallii var. hallii]
MENKLRSLPAVYVLMMTTIVLAITVSSSRSVVVHCTEAKAAHQHAGAAVAHPDGGRRGWGPPTPRGGTLRRPYMGRRPVHPPPPSPAPPLAPPPGKIGRSG